MNIWVVVLVPTLSLLVAIGALYGTLYPQIRDHRIEVEQRKEQQEKLKRVADMADTLGNMADLVFGHEADPYRGIRAQEGLGVRFDKHDRQHEQMQTSIDSLKDTVEAHAALDQSRFDDIERRLEGGPR